jgi:DNA polymerase-1
MNNSRPELLLIDGHGVAYRQYFALLKAPTFVTSRGEPTNATFGFARTLLDILLAPTPPKYLAVAFDQGLSGRELAYPEYKGTRDEMQASLSLQLGRIRQLVSTFNIPILEKAGFEADDVIGTAARLAVPLGVDVHVLTGDFDLTQLIDEFVRIEVQTVRKEGGKNISESKIYDATGVLERYGVRPDQIPDYKGLVGDNSDNIPGVRGVGDKTAMQLLQQYGTVENIYEHLDEQKGKLREKLEVGRDNAFLSKKLATILTDVPITLDLDACVAHDFDRNAVIALFQELEFKSTLRRFETAFAPKVELTPAAPKPETNGTTQHALFDMGSHDADNAPIAPIKAVVHTILVDTEESLGEMVKALAAASTIAFDTETTGTDQMRADLVGISLAVNPDEGYYIPVGHAAGDQLPLARVIESLRPAMTDPGKQKWAHNAVYDLIMLRRYGLDVTPITFDTMVAESVLNPESRRKGLKDQAQDRLGVGMVHIEELIGKGKSQITMDRVNIDRAAAYAAADAAITFRLVPVMRGDLERAELLSLFEDIEMPLVPVIADLDMAGAKLDLAYLGELGLEFNARLDEISKRIFELAGEPFNIGSLKQLNEVLFTRLALPTKGLRKNSNGFSVDSDALEKLLEATEKPGQEHQHEIVKLLLDWRALEKLRSTYVDALLPMVDAEGRIHTEYNQIGSVTGRISSEAPNLQNIPVRTEEGRRVRKAFIAPEGFRLLSVDYSQIELRILAHYSGDEFLITTFANDQDIHKATAAAVYNIPFDQVTKEQRYFAKRVNFGLMYGMGAARLVRESGGMSKQDAEKFIDEYFNRFTGVKRYFDDQKRLAKEQGYLTTILGRRKSFNILTGPKADDDRGEYARAEREAINMPIQGSNADIIKKAMIALSARLKAIPHCRVRLILQVHDELVLEVPEAEIAQTAALVREVMENVVTLRTPIRADANVGQNWADMTPVES